MSIPRDRMVIVPVSEWMREEMSKSFFRDSRFEVIHNGIDTSVFHPCEGLEMHRHLGVGADKKSYSALRVFGARKRGLMISSNFHDL